MTLMMKATSVQLRFLLSLVLISLSINHSFGENAYNFGSKRLLPMLEVPSAFSSPTILTVDLLMEDTVCTSISLDTFYVNTLPFVDTYNWSIPAGATIASNLGDTMIIVDWTNANPGLSNICIETMNNCGISTPTCFPIRIIVCNLIPDAADDQGTTPANVAILIDVQDNDSDPDNDPLTTGLDSTNEPDNGTLAILGNDIQYTPNPNFTGIDIFQYYICDNGNPMFCDTAMVTITVENSAPIATPDTIFTIAGSPITIPVQANDSDPENHDLTTNLDATNPPSKGTVSVNGTDIIYTPTGNETGSDEFSYVICDNGTPILCDTTTVTVNINNQAPNAVDDRDTTLSNQSIIIAVQGNDTDPENGTLTTALAVNNGPSNGMVSIVGNNIQYTPDTDFMGNDSFEYIVCDDGTPNKCDTAKVDVVVLNQAPIAQNDLTSTQSGIAINIPVQDNDSDPENGILTTTLDANNGPANGMATLSGNDIIYTPGIGFSGTDNFDYIICDDGSPILCDTATVTISTENQAPIAIADNHTTPFETAITIDVQDNDSDPENGVLTTSLNPNTPPSNGVISILNSDSILYTPNVDFLGTDQFEYIICDNGSPSLCDTTMVTINVPNDRPIALNDNNTTLEDTPVMGTILGNDSDPNRNDLILNLVLISSPDNGTINLNPDGSYLYSPDAHYFGADTFTYQVCDDQTPSLCDTAIVSITVTAVNDAPIAINDTNNTNEDTPVDGTVLPNDIDIENDNLVVNTTPIDQPDNGMLSLNPDGTYTYTPDSGFNGTDSFEYEVCDDGNPVACDTATVTIFVGAVNDPPMAVDDPITTDEDMPVTGSLLPNDTDPEGDNLVVSTTPVDEPDNGAVSINPDGTFTYTPDPNFEGTDSFQYEVCDNGIPSLCDTATVTITVNPENDSPMAMDDPITTDEDMPVSGSLLPNDTDPDGDNLVVSTTPVDEPDNGTVSINPDGTFTYTPDPNFEGTDTFQYEVCDDGNPVACDTATVTITVNPENDSPMAMDDSYPLTEDTPLTDNLTTNDSDPENDNLTVTTTPVNSPNNGTVTLSTDGTFTYTPDPSFNGRDTFFYEICDDGNPILCDTAKVILAIDPENDPPVAIDDIVVTPINKPAQGDLLTNDFDPENDDITVNTIPVETPTNGRLTINPDGSYTYQPDFNFVGEDSFDYEICDNGIPQACDTATVVVYIIDDNVGVNDPPIAINDNFVTNVNKPIIAVNLLTNDVDPDGDDLILNTTPINPPTNGVVFILPNGNATYTPTTDFIGADVFTYRICDNGIPILCDTATVSITILPAANTTNSTYANDDVGLTYQDVPLLGILNDNDNDPEGDNQFLQPTPITLPSNGTVTINNNGTFEYVPNAGYVGADLFTYQICDDGTPVACDLATVYLTVLVRNTPPYAIDNINVIPINGTAKGDLLANDFDLDGDDIIIKIAPIENVSNGMVTINPDGSYVYVPNTDYVGEDVFTYQICDDGTPVLCDTATVTIEIIDNSMGNDPPVGVNDVFVTLVNTKVNSNLITNDFDPDGDVINIVPTPVNEPSNGMVTINADGTFQYMPALNFTGDDYFTYRVCDNQNPSLCTEVVVSITIIPISNINFTFANDDVASTTEDTPVSGTLLANDTDPEGHDQNINPTPVIAPVNGQVSINLDGTYTYTPNPNYFGDDQFMYTICDNGTPSACDEARVFLIITEVNDAPIALEDVNNTILNTPVAGNVLTNDFELDGDKLVLNTTIAITPTNGTVTLKENGSYVYQPNLGFIGEDRFEYEVCDNKIPSACDTTHVIIEVLVAYPERNNPPNGVEDNLQTNINVPITGSLLSNDSDIDGDVLLINTTPLLSNFTINNSNSRNNSATQHGEVTINDDGTFSYTPNTGYVGEDNFQYEICDGGTPNLCDTVLVTIDIIANPFNINRIYAADDAKEIWEDQSTTGQLLANDHHPNGFPFSVNTTPIQLPQNGIVEILSNGTYTYVPFGNYYGPDRFLYGVCDNQNPSVCDTATVYLTIQPIQDPPIAKDDINVTLVNTAVTGFVLTNDRNPDGSGLVVTATPLKNPENGTVVLGSDGIYDYTPNTDFSGKDAFTYIICDDQATTLCDTAIVSIKIVDLNNPDNNPPVGGDDVNFGIVNLSLIGHLLANDIDPDGDPFNITTTPISTPTNGIVVINPDGTYEYTPNPDFIGEDIFEYEICDLGNPSKCDTVQVRLEIFPQLRNTIFANDDVVLGQEDTPILGALLVNDFDPQNDNIILDLSPKRMPQHGTVTLNSDGSFSYFPVKDYNGPDQFDYEICDDNNPIACDIATAYLTILPVTDTLCNEALPRPTLLTSKAVCFTEDIHLFIQENYPLFTLENTNLDFEFSWFNSLGDTIATTTDPNFTIAATDPMALSPFTVKVKLGDCSSDFANPVTVAIAQLPTIIATTTDGSQGVCLNGSTQLMATTVEGATYTWRIAGDATIIATEQNPIINNINTATTFEVQVKPALCDVFSTASVTVTVNPGPTINPQLASGALVCLGSSFQLESNATGLNPMIYQWTGPNNFTSNAANPVISNASFDNSGSYTLEVTDAGGCINRADLIVDAISAGLEKPVTNNNSPVCIDGSIVINLQTQYNEVNISYNWINGLGNTVSTERNLHIPANDPAAVSPFFLQVSVGGCRSPNSDLVEIDIQDTPIALATATTTSICTGGEVQLFGNEINAATYEWRALGNPTILSTLRNPVFRNIQQDTSFTLRVIGGVCPNKFAIDTIAISVSPAVDFSPSRIYTLNQDCSVSDLQLEANIEMAINGLSFQWTGPNNYSSSEQNPTIANVNEAFNGAYTLEVTNENGCSTSKTIFVNDIQGNLPKPIISALNAGCSSDNIMLEAPQYEGSSVVYNWLRNGGLVGTNSHQLFIDNAQVGQSYRLVIQVNGCILESNTFQPLVFDQPTVVIEDNLPTICTNGVEDITLNATIEGGQAPYDIVWTSTTGFQSFNEDAVIVNATETLSGTYSIEIIDQNGCTAKASTSVDIKEAPTQPVINVDNTVCEGAITTLSVANYEGVNVVFNWEVPNAENIIGLTSNELLISPIQKGLHQGTYSLSVEIDGCTSTAEPVQLEVIALPSIQPAGIYINTLNCANNNLNLSANLSDSTSLLNFDWTGPNGFMSTAENPVIVNASPANNGQYFLKITNNNGCSISAATNVIDNIRNGITQPVIQGTTSLCEGETITLTAPIYMGSSVTYSWLFNDEVIPNANGFELIIPQADAVLHQGVYNLLVEVDSCQSLATPVAVDILAIPSISPTAIYNSTANCAPANLVLNANLASENNGLTFAWTGPNGFSSTVENPVIVNATQLNNGQYVLLVTNNAGCTISQATNIIDNIKDGIAQPVIQGTTTLCEGETITLTAPIYSGTTVKYSWFLNDVIIPNANNFELIITQSVASAHEGNYKVLVEVDGCQSEATPVNVDLFVQPTINPEAVFTRTENCTGSNLVLKANLQGNSTGLTFVWTGPNGFSSTVENPVIINATTENNGQYILLVTNNAGCSYNQATNVIENIAPVLPQPIIQTSEAVCEGGLMTLSAPIYTGGDVNYVWLLNGTAIDGENANEITIGPLVDNGDSYQLEVQVDECTLSSEVIIPNILPTVSINPTYELSAFCEGSTLQLSANRSGSIGTITYNWVGPNGYTSNAENPFIGNTNETFNGTYTLTISTLAGCETSNSLTVMEIINAPEQPVVLTNGPVCKDGMIELAAQETNMDDQSIYIWSNGNGETIGRERAITFPANAPLAIPPYSLKVSMADCGAIFSVPTQVEVIELPQISISNSGPVCQGSDVQLMAVTIENATYTWTDAQTGTIVSTLQNPTILNIDTATTFNLKVSLPGCENSVSVSTTVEINKKPIITGLAATTSLCEGQDLVLTATNGNPDGKTVTYTWTGPNEFNFTNESSDSTFPVTIPNFSALQVGAYQLTVGNAGGCIGASRSIVVGLNEALTTPNLMAAANLVCGGSSISLTASTENGQGVRYEWYLQTVEGDLLLIRETTTPTMIIGNVSSANSGEYIVRILKDDCVSGYSNTAEITVLDITTNIIASNNTSSEDKLCEGGVIQLAVPFFEGATYSWFGPAGYSSDKANPIISPATPLAAGDYFAIVSIDGCTGIISSRTTVYINPKPATPTIINDGPVCLGGTLTLTVSSPLSFEATDTLSYEWYDATSNALIRTTTEPQLILANVSDNQSGGYYLRMIANGCEAEASNETVVEILSTANLMASAGDNQFLCAASTANLMATEVVNATGMWSSPTGAIIMDTTLASTTVSNLQVGINQFVWTVTSNQCAAQSIDTVEIEIEMVVADVAFAGLDRDVCETDAINLAATPLKSAAGVWTQSIEQTAQGVLIMDQTNPTSLIEGLEPGNSYTFIWTISENECPNFEADTVQLNINDIPSDNALVREETIALCEEDQLTLSAEIPTFSTGQWLSESGATIANPISPTTFAENLSPGENVFIWALSNGACVNYSMDTVTVHSERTPIVNADNYEMNLNDTLVMNVLENDIITANMDIRFVITKYPDNGELIEGENGLLTYKPQGNFFGFDNFRYKVCSNLCESLCDTAIVTIGVTGVEGSGDCIIPNVISPNEDGNNDYFLVSCIDLFPDNYLRIFNRWGDKVYETRNYQNDWAGTHDEQPLPSGTYFYMLQLEEEGKPLQGFITIFR